MRYIIINDFIDSFITAIFHSNVHQKSLTDDNASLKSY